MPTFPSRSHSSRSLASASSLFFNDTATTEIYTLSLHDALPICRWSAQRKSRCMSGRLRGALTCRDRKSTRLNSSHLGISYAVFCLKKIKGSEELRAARVRHGDGDVANATGVARAGAVPLVEQLFFFNDTATTEIYTLSLHDALPIWWTADSVWTTRQWATSTSAEAAL